MSAERLTSKYLKFTPPEWMERYDWLIGYAPSLKMGLRACGEDHDMTINLSKLPKFLQAWTEKRLISADLSGCESVSGALSRPLLMLRWYWKDCSDAFDCSSSASLTLVSRAQPYCRHDLGDGGHVDQAPLFSPSDALTRACSGPEYVRTSRRNIEQWKASVGADFELGQELMTRLHTAKSPFQPPLRACEHLIRVAQAALLRELYRGAEPEAREGQQGEAGLCEGL